MVVDDSSLYHPIWIEQWTNSWPWYRRILARYFDKFKGGKEEYKEWLFKRMKC